MITKNHPTAYAELFKKAQEVLSKYGQTNSEGNRVTEAVTISNIDDYFGVLKALAEIEQRAESGNISEYIDPIFTILPATEETFNIDANSRKISIPDNFAKYGAGVQGDEIAEILYFSIDRYFDAMDLAEMDILIQWKHSADNDLPESLSATYKKSLTLQPGKIVFGWPITKEMTERSGNIQFSVRFYRRQNNTLIYNFSTLPAQVKIQSGLDFELNDESIALAINKNTAIYNNLRNSVPANIAYVVAAPVFEARWVQAQDSDELVPANQPTYDLPITLAAKAKFADNDDGEISGNGISYSWYKEGNSVPMESTHGYKIATQGEYNNDKEIYYILNNGVYEPYYSDGNPFDDEDVDNVYVRYGKFVPAAAGVYYVKATNAYTHNSSIATDSEKWTIPGPSDPDFTYNNNDRNIIMELDSAVAIGAVVKNNDQLKSDKWYQSNNATFDNQAKEVVGVNGETYTPTAEGYYFREVVISRNNEDKIVQSQSVWARHQASAIANLQYLVNGSVVTNLAVNIDSVLGITFDSLTFSSTISYQWYHNGVAIESEDGKKPTYVAKEQGNYYCIITNSYKGTSNSAQSDTFKV